MKERKKEIILKTWTLNKREVHIKKKGRIHEFEDIGKVNVMDFWYQKNKNLQRRKVVER